MNRLIDRSNLKMEIKKWLKPSAANESTMVALDDIAISVLMTIEEQPLVKAIPLDKVKQAREEISEMRKEHNVSVTDCLDVLDKLIESEEK